MDDLPPLDPATLARLEAYAVEPRVRRTVRPWTVDELMLLLNPAVPVTAIMDRLGVKRAVVTYELVRLRRAGFVVPDRPCSWERSPRTRAIESDLRAGMTATDAARKHGLSPARIREIRVRAGIPARPWAWTDDERTILVARQDQPTRDVAALLGRTVRAVDAERSRLIGQCRIRPRIQRPRRSCT